MSRNMWWAVRAGLSLLVIAGLAIDAYVHLDLASAFDGVKSSVLTQGDLFRVEAALAIVAALAVIVRPRRYTALIAFVVSAGGVGAVLLYQYVDVGAIGPLPNMYDPTWYPEKTLSLWGEVGAAVAALALLVVTHLQLSRVRATANASEPARDVDHGARSRGAVTPDRGTPRPVSGVTRHPVDPTR